MGRNGSLAHHRHALDVFDRCAIVRAESKEALT